MRRGNNDDDAKGVDDESNRTEVSRFNILIPKGLVASVLSSDVEVQPVDLSDLLSSCGAQQPGSIT